VSISANIRVVLEQRIRLMRVALTIENREYAIGVGRCVRLFILFFCVFVSFILACVALQPLIPAFRLHFSRTVIVYY
jgi:hypothetical protein